jgi:hypothetical protein
MTAGDFTSVPDYLRKLRRDYVEWYRSALRSKRQQGAECKAEVWVTPNVPPGQSRPPHPLCVDILTREQDRQAMMMVARNSDAGALAGTMFIRDVPIKVYAPIWEDFIVWLRHADPDWAALDEWRKKWMEPRPSGEADEDGLTGVVHYFGTPTAEGGGYFYQIDFGSAPVEALTELLDALVSMGATEIELGRSDGSDLPADILAELQRPELPLHVVMSLAQQVLAGLDTVESVEAASPEQLKVYRNGQKNPCSVFLGNLHRLLQRTGIEARPLEFYRFLRGQSETMISDLAPADLSQLRLVVKDDRFLDNIAKIAPGMKPLKQKLAADLWLMCVWDSPNGMRFANLDEPEKYGVSADQMLDRAMKNYLDQPVSPQLAEHGRLLIAQTRDSYDPTLLVNDAWWTEISSRVQGEILVCVPARHVVLIGGAATPGIVAEMCQAASRIEAGGDHLISNTILVRRKGKWEEFREEPAQAKPQTSPPASTAKRPWWRFW